jgi:hypothetical protein
MYPRKSIYDFFRVCVTFIAYNTEGQGCRFVSLLHILAIRDIIVDPQA